MCFTSLPTPLDLHSFSPSLWVCTTLPIPLNWHFLLIPLDFHLLSLPHWICTNPSHPTPPHPSPHHTGFAQPIPSHHPFECSAQEIKKAPQKEPLNFSFYKLSEKIPFDTFPLNISDRSRTTNVACNQKLMTGHGTNFWYKKKRNKKKTTVSCMFCMFNSGLHDFMLPFHFR